MQPKFHHTPASTRARCPVCQQPVYSRAGIHPQCAVRRAEAPGPRGKAKASARPAPGPIAAEPDGH